MSQTTDFIDAAGAIRSASALTETTFLGVAQRLEASIEILGNLTSRFEAMLMDLAGDNLNEAFAALAGTAARIGQLGESQAGEATKFATMVGLTESISRRIADMKASLKDVGSLAVNARIAAAGIRLPGVDFAVFANEIGRTLQVTRATLDRFIDELNVVRLRVAAAHHGLLSFETYHHAAARSIAERLSATVASITLQHQRAARAGAEVKLSSDRVRQRIGEAILALQIGDITRQRLEHANAVLGLVAEARDIGDDARDAFIAAAHRIQSAQLADAAQNFERDVRKIAESLTSLAAEAHAARRQGDTAYGSADRDGGGFIGQLEGQVGEVLALFEGFETARAEVAGVTATVSDATASLCGHLRTIHALEDDIRIMGLNTAFKCARIGREGLALSVIAQELRGYANGFAKAADALMREVEAVAELSRSSTGIDGQGAEDGTRAARELLAALRRMGQGVDAAMADLAHDSDGVETLLVETVANLAARNRIGEALRAAGLCLAALVPEGWVSAGLAPCAARMLEAMERGYTMASERAVHDRVLGRAALAVAPVAEPEDFLF